MNQYSAAVVCQQPGELDGRKAASFPGHHHAQLPCLAPSRRAQLEGGKAAVGPWDEAHGSSAFQASVGCWNKRVLPMRKPPRRKGAECLLQHIGLQGTHKGKGWSSCGQEEMLCRCCWCFPIWVCAHPLPLPLLSTCCPAALTASLGAC